MAMKDSINEICDIRVELRGTDPLIWRHVEVPTSITLLVLHDIIQIVMNWYDCHLWEFTIGDRHYGRPIEQDGFTADDPLEEPSIPADKVRLRDVLRPRRTVINYLYDFGDSWEHRLTVTKVRQGEPGASYPRLVAGEWAAPPEDCGGIPGFYDALAALADPNHAEHAEVAEFLNGYDPADIDTVGIGFGLSRIANRRNAARVRATRKRTAT